MATPDDGGVSEILARALKAVPEPTWTTMDDLTRMSREAVLRDMGGNPREAPSTGTLRIHRPGNRAVTLAQAGHLQVAWQRAVSSVGAATVGFKGLRGRLPQSILQGTELAFVSHAPGSVVIEITPTSPPLAEVEPHGNPVLTGLESDRPLADRAASRLIAVLSSQDSGEDALVEELADLGPRVGSAVRALAQAVGTAECELTASWDEPERPTCRVAVNPQRARRIMDVVTGRHLDAEHQTVVGTIRTVSDVRNWDIETEEGARIVMSARGLSEAQVRKVNVGDLLEVVALESVTEMPDGTTRSVYTIESLRALE